MFSWPQYSVHPTAAVLFFLLSGLSVSHVMSIELEHAIGCNVEFKRICHIHPNGRDYLKAVGGVVIVGDLKDPHAQVFCQGHDDFVTCLAVSHAGQLFATGQQGENADVILWSFEGKTQLSCFQEQDHGIDALAFSHDDRFLISCGDIVDQRVFVYDTTSCLIVAWAALTPKPTLCVLGGGMVRDIKRRDTQEYQFAACGGKNICMWHLDPVRGELQPHQVGNAFKQVREYICLAFTQDKEYLLAGSTTGDVAVVLMKNRVVQTFVAVCGAGVVNMVCTPVDAGCRFVAAGGDGTVTVLAGPTAVDIHEERQIRLDGPLSSLSLAPDHSEVLAVSTFGTACLIRSKDLSVRPHSQVSPGALYDVVHPANVSDHFLTCSGDSLVTLWDANDYTAKLRCSVGTRAYPLAACGTEDIFAGIPELQLRPVFLCTVFHYRQVAHVTREQAVGSMDPENTFTSASASAQQSLRQAMSRRYMKKHVLCKYFADNTCSRGKTCRFAHSVSLMSYRPNPPATRLANVFGEPAAQGEVDFVSHISGPSASPISDSGPTGTMDSGTDSSGSQKGSTKLDPGSSASTGVSSRALRMSRLVLVFRGALMEALKQKLLGKGGTLGEWTSLVTNGLQAEDMLWVEAGTHKGDLLGYARGILNQGSLVEYECHDTRGKPQGKAVIRLIDWDDYSAGSLKASHICASDEYYEWYATRDIADGKAVYHICQSKRTDCTARLGRGDRREMIHLQRWRMTNPLVMLEHDYSRECAMRALERAVDHYERRVPEPGRPPAPDPTGLDKELAGLGGEVEAELEKAAKKAERGDVVVSPKGSVGAMLEKKAAERRAALAAKEVERRKRQGDRGRSRSRRRRRRGKSSGSGERGERSRSSESSRSFPKPSAGGRVEMWRLSQKNPGSLLKQGMKELGRYLADRAPAEEGAEGWMSHKMMAYISQVVLAQHPPAAIGVRNHRELLTLGKGIDMLNEGRLPELGDLLMQRLKALETPFLDQGWHSAKHRELIPPHAASLMTEEERRQRPSRALSSQAEGDAAERKEAREIGTRRRCPVTSGYRGATPIQPTSSSARDRDSKGSDRREAPDDGRERPGVKEESKGGEKPKGKGKQRTLPFRRWNKDKKGGRKGGGKGKTKVEEVKRARSPTPPKP
eukprot:s1615_g14.t1